MKTKILLWSFISLVVAGVIAGAYWWLSRPQTLLLEDGTRVTLLAVTYGKHHALPRKEVGGRRIRMGKMTTTNDSLCLWIDLKHKKNYWPNFQLLAYDAARTACSGSQDMTYGYFNGNDMSEHVVGIAFEAFPRRGRKVYFRFQQWNQTDGRQEMSSDGFVVRNPAPHQHYAKWTPDILPVTREDGDLQVTLTRFESTTNRFNYYRSEADPNDPANKWLLAAFRIEQNGQVATNWQPVEIETSDVTGNHTKNRGRSNEREGDEETMSYQWGLWPDEPAWKLNVEMSRTSGFTADEMWTASEIPLKPGSMNDIYMGGRRDKPFVTTTLGDKHVSVFPVIQLPSDQMRNFGGNVAAVVLIRVDPPPQGMRLTVSKITDDQNRPIDFQYWGWGGSDHRFALKKLGDAKSITVTLALHRSRYVEFSVQPPRK